MTTQNSSSQLLQAVFRVHGIGQSVEDEELTDEMINKHGIATGSVAAVKKLFTEQLKPFRKAASAARTYHTKHTFEGFGASRLIVVGEQTNYSAAMNSKIERINQAKRAFIAAYPEHLERERELKKTAFNAEDYPEAELLHELFRVQFLIIPMAEPNEFLKTALTGDVTNRLANEYRSALSRATEGIRRQTLGTMLSLIAGTAESLAGDGVIFDSEGKKGPLAKLKEYLDRIPALNITSDPEITRLAAECSRKLNVSTDMLRTSKFVRQQTASAALDIAKRFGQIAPRCIAA